MLGLFFFASAVFTFHGAVGKKVSTTVRPTGHTHRTTKIPAPVLTQGNKTASVNISDITFEVPMSLNNPTPYWHIVQLVEDAVKMSPIPDEFKKYKLQTITQVPYNEANYFYRGSSKSGPAMFDAMYGDGDDNPLSGCGISFRTDGKSLKEARVTEVPDATCY